MMSENRPAKASRFPMGEQARKAAARVRANEFGERALDHKYEPGAYGVCPRCGLERKHHKDVE